MILKPINETFASPATMKHVWGLKDQRMVWKPNLELGMLFLLKDNASTVDTESLN